ncbi:MAG: hypothetical protein KJ718_02595 [Nanoarchaeota archaeon]|nr:hypothetical protein [Nanoarchaeota archaeon]MBU1051419.1 hypothetical protein [Nanoarchaeota archaeon]
MKLTKKKIANTLRILEEGEICKVVVHQFSGDSIRMPLFREKAGVGK